MSDPVPQQPETITATPTTTTIAFKYPDLLSYCAAILSTGDSALKCSLTHEALDLFTNHDLPVGDQISVPTTPDCPARPDNLVVIHFTQVQGKVKGDTMESNRLRMIHQQAHIESYAIDLSIDIMARFADYRCVDDSYLPREFFADWLLVADDEARHFTTWNQRLIDAGSHYGAFPTHDALWESALLTKHDLMARLSVVHLIHEAHGLDCGDRLLNQFLGMRDKKSADFFRQITRDEVTHVAAGFKWYNYIGDKMIEGGVCQNGQHYQKSDDEIQEERHNLIRKHITNELRAKIEEENAKMEAEKVGEGEEASSAPTPSSQQPHQQLPSPEDLQSLVLKADLEQQNLLATLNNNPDYKDKALCLECPDHFFNPVFHFHHLVKDNFHGAPRPPFNHSLRLQAGMTPEWYEPLVKIKKEGEKLNVKQLMAQRKAKLAAEKAEKEQQDEGQPSQSSLLVEANQ